MTGPGRPLYVTMPASTVWLRSRRRAMAGCYCSRAAGLARTVSGNPRARVMPPGKHPWRSPGTPSFGLLFRALSLLRLTRADRRDALGDRDLEALGRPRRVIELRHRDARQALADRALDLPEIRLLVGRDERERVALQLRARRAAHAVDVVLGDVRDVEVHDVRKGLDVDPARRDVRRDEHLELPVLEPGERLRALRLAAVAVNSLAGHAVALELVREAV